MRSGIARVHGLIAIVLTALVVGMAVWLSTGGNKAPEPAPAAAVQEAPAEKWQKDLIKEWKLGLGAFESTREQARFLREHDVQFRFLEDSGGEFLASYTNKKVYINKTPLLRDLENLKKEGVPEENLLHVLAAVNIGPMAHELRHGITHEKIKMLTGLYYAEPTLEDEFLAFYAEMRIFLEMNGKTGFLTERGQVFLRIKQEGPETLWKFTKFKYGGVPSIEDPVGLLLPIARRHLQLAKELYEISEYKRRPDADEDTLRKNALTEKKLRQGRAANEFPEEDLPDIIQRLEETILILESPKKLEILRQFYRDERARIIREWPK